nr:MAG TPA: hypothetical protein [Caudoviricetes sp.]
MHLPMHRSFDEKMKIRSIKRLPRPRGIRKEFT